MNLDLSELKDVTLETERVSGMVFGISFQLRNYVYYLTLVRDKNEKHQPEAIHHYTRLLYNQACAFCQTSYTTCPILTKNKEMVFEIAIQHPSIRLPWLFLR